MEGGCPFKAIYKVYYKIIQQNHYCPIHDNRRTNIRTEVVFVCSRFLLFAGNPTHDLYTGWSILLASPQRAGSLRLLQTRLGLRSGIDGLVIAPETEDLSSQPESGEFYVGIWRCEGESYGIGEL